MAFAVILPIVLTIAALVAVFVFILPEHRRGQLSPLLNRIRDFLTMRHLYLEKFLRGLYVVFTVITVVVSLCMPLTMLILGISMRQSFSHVLQSVFLGLLGGVILAIVFAFLLRIGFENVMLMISLTKAAKDINEKLGGESPARSYDEPRRRPAPAPRPVVCRRCGVRYDPRRGRCPNGCDDRW